MTTPTLKTSAARAAAATIGENTRELLIICGLVQDAQSRAMDYLDRLYCSQESNAHKVLNAFAPAGCLLRGLLNDAVDNFFTILDATEI